MDSFVGLFFAVLLLTVSPCPAICKSGGTFPPVPYGVGGGTGSACQQSQNSQVTVRGSNPDMGVNLDPTDKVFFFADSGSPGGPN